MDEDTIDCTICGGNAYVEVLCQALTDRAEWDTTYRYLVCRRHLERLHFSLDQLHSSERVVINHCG